MKKYSKSVVALFMALALMFCFASCGNSITDEQAKEAKTIGDEVKKLFDEAQTKINSLATYYGQGSDNFDSRFDQVKKTYEDALEIYERRVKEYNEKDSDNTKEEAEAFIKTLKSAKKSLESQIAVCGQLQQIIDLALQGAETTEE